MHKLLYFLSFFSLVALAADRVIIDGNLNEPEWKMHLLQTSFIKHVLII
jgi:hypothetical protein